MKNFNQPAPAFGPYDPQAPRVKPDTSTPARLTAVAVEDAIRNDSLETGVFIGASGCGGAALDGQPNRVAFTEADLSAMAGSTFTHNHPGNASFSLQDYEAALFAQIAELRVVTPQFRHVLVLTDQAPSAEVVEALSLQLTPRLSRQVQDIVNTDQLPSGASLIELQHLFWVTLARNYGLKYFRERS